eukprot:2973192-Rhodomonas_salina.1
MARQIYGTSDDSFPSMRDSAALPCLVPPCPVVRIAANNDDIRPSITDGRLRCLWNGTHSR